ncbi:MAG: VWA domain-containing protein [Alphaproteobacteria bacterium]|nr:VWA domain-containing protein [Alphaproteobacteria bacterium]
MNKSAFLFAACLLIAPAMLARAANAQGAALLVVDVSGSMTAAQDGDASFDVVRSVLGKMLPEAPKGISFGAEVFGQQGNADCSAIRILVPPTQQGAGKISAALDLISTSGGASPVADALATASFALRAADGDKTVILIADGGDSCGGSPENAAAKMTAQDGIRLFITGYNVTDADRPLLKAMARAAGTPYREASDPAALKTALADIFRGLSAPKVVFRDDFGGDYLGDAWNLLEPDADAAVLDEGKFIVLNAVGDLSQTTKNLLVLGQPVDLKNYEIVTEFSTAFVENLVWYKRGDMREGAAVGLYLYTDQDNFVRVNLTFDSRGLYPGVHASFAKYTGGKAPKAFERTMFNPSDWLEPQTYRLKIRREGRNYTGFYFNFDKSEWVELGTYKVLKSKFRPALFAFRGNNSKEHTTEFDWFEVRSLE